MPVEDADDDASDIVGEDEAEDILLLATLIGIDADETEYLWIAKEAYQADLPSGWEIYFDEDGKHFYFNSESHASTYEHPSIEFYRKLYQEFKAKDAEFREHQEEQELLAGAGSPSAMDQEGDDGDDKPTNDMSHKARLLQTFSTDPTIAAKFRKDMAEQDQKATTVLQLGLRKQEQDFEKRLRAYVVLREEAKMKPLEQVLASFAQQNEQKLDKTLEVLTSQMAELKEKASKGSDEAILAALRQAQQSQISEGQRAKRMNMLGSKMQDCKRCKEHEERLAQLEIELTELKHMGGLAGDGRPDSAAVRSAVHEAEKKGTEELRTAHEEIEGLKKAQKKLKDDNRRLRRKIAQGGGHVHDGGVEGRDGIAALADQAAQMDAETPTLEAGAAEALLAAAKKGDESEEEHEEEEGEAAGDMQGLLREFSLSEADLMDIMERMEGMQGGANGPLAALRAQLAELEGVVSQRQEETLRAQEHAEKVDEVNAQYVASLAKVETLTAELQRAKDHSEHMEFLAQQYSEQVAQLHSAMRKMRDEVALEQRTREEERNTARAEALATKKDAKTPTPTQKPPPPASSTASGGARTPTTATGPFVVRVRASTIRDVKQGASTLRAALNLLKIDFQAYAEGIFLPLARQLQQNTLVLATALSGKSRDLRLSHEALDASLAGQRFLEEQLHLVYSINFHSFAYLRPLRENERTIFRSPSSRQLTMALEAGFENKRDLLETYEFERVIGPESDAVAIFHEIVPHVSRVLNWGTASVIVVGGRHSEKHRVAISADVGAYRGSKGVMQKAMEYMAQIHQNEVDSLTRQRNLEAYDVTLAVELSEVYEEKVSHAIMTGQIKKNKKDDDDEERGDERHKGPSLLDMQTLMTNVKASVVAGGEGLPRPGTGRSSDGSKKEGEGDEDEDEEGEVEEEEADGGALGDLGRPQFVPTNFVQNATEGLRLVEEAYQRSQGALRLKQQQLDRESSDAVQRSKRLAKPGSRSELGELIPEPHYVLSIAVSKRDRQTHTTQLALLKVVLLGSPGEYEDTDNPDPKAGVRFKAEKDQSTHTLEQFLEKRYVRETDTTAEMANSELTYLVWDVLGEKSAVVFLTAVSPSATDFASNVADLRFAAKAIKVRPTTASRLERVKYRWTNQSIVWAFTLWKGALVDSVAVQQGNQIANLKEEVELQKGEVARLTRKIEEMANEGVAYQSGGEEKQDDDEDAAEADSNDLLLAQRRMLEKVIGRDILAVKQKEEGAVLQAVTAKLRYTQSRLDTYESNNKNLSKALRAERQRSRLAAVTRAAASGVGGLQSSKGVVRMPEVQGARSLTPTAMMGGSLRDGSRRTSFPSAVGNGGSPRTLPPASKKQAYG